MKRLGMATIAATAALMAFAGTASATTLTSPTGTVTTPTIEAASEEHVVLDNPIAKIECASLISGTAGSHGPFTPQEVKLSGASFTSCTNSWHVTVVGAGDFSISHTSGYNGTVRWNGATFEATRFGISCRYATSNTTVGTLTGGTPATIDISAAIPFHGGSALCGSSAVTWTGAYKVSSPASLFVDA